jgi:archaellum biogenesis ATPase FlaH
MSTPAAQPNTTLKAAYGDAFEAAVIWLLITDMQYADVMCNALDADCFENINYSTIFEAAKALYATHNAPPSTMAIATQLAAQIRMCKPGSRLEARYQSARKHLRRIVKSPARSGADCDFIKSKTGMFITKARVRTALLGAGDLWEKEKFDELLAGIEGAVHASERSLSGDVGIEFGDYKSRLREYAKIKKHSKACPSGIPLLDSKMRGGLAPASLGVVMGPAGRGKSLVLVSVGANCLAHGLNIAVATLELRRHDYSMRFDARLTGLPVNEIASNTKKHVRTLVRRTKQLTGRLFVQHWGSNTATISDLHVWLKTLQTKHSFSPDLLIVDYVDLLMAPGTRSDRPDIGILCKGLRQLGADFNCAVWSASQSNRSSYDGRSISLDQVSDDIQKVQVADVVVGIGQTQREKDVGKARLFLLKNRQGGFEGTVVDCNMIENTMSLTQAATQAVVSSRSNFNARKGGTP